MIASATMDKGSRRGRAPAAAAENDVVTGIDLLRRALTRAACAAFSGSGVGPKQVLILHEIHDDEGICQVDLAQATLTDPAGLMRALDALEKRRWIRREPCADDRRRKRISLTPEGRRALADVDRSFEAFRTAANSTLTRAEQRQFCELAAKVATGLEAVSADRGCAGGDAEDEEA